MNWRNRKLWLLLLAGGALIALLILAAGITTVEFEKGISLGSLSLRRDQGAISFQAGSGDLLKVFGFVIMALLPATIVYLMLSPEARRRFLINLIQLGIFLLFLYYLSTQLGKKEGESTLQLPEGFKQPEITDP